MSVSDNKKFIILQEDDKGFSFNNKTPSGYTKIESKDFKFKIFYYIQNINNENTYSLNLIVKNDSNKIDIISIGEVKSDSNGKIDISYDFDESMLDSVCGSAICVKDLKGELKFPLSGFLPKKRVFNWKISQFRGIRNRPFRKDNYSFERKKEVYVKKNETSYDEVHDVQEDSENIDKDVKEKDDVSVKNKDVEDKTYLNEEFCSEEDENLDEMEFRSSGIFLMSMYDQLDLLDIDNSYSESRNVVKNIYNKHEENVKKIIDMSKEGYEQAKHHIEALKKLLIKDDGKIEKMIKSILPNMCKKNREINGDYDYRFFLNILNEYDEIHSLNYEGYVFFKVYIDNFSQMKNMEKYDNIKYAIIYYPMIFMYPYFKDKGYFIVGLNYDEDKNISNIVYGVEVNEGMESLFPYDGKTGFNRYVYDYEKSKGYHIMEYDYKEFKVK